MRLLWTALALTLLFTVPFLLWGDDFLRWFTGDAALLFVRRWGALGVIALLMADLFLPIPATPVMSAAGYLYGTLVGGLISAAGSFAAGLLGYSLCRLFGQKIARRLAGPAELESHATFFARRGPLLVAASRWLPLLPEVISCLAGLTRMPLRLFATALACGSLPLGFTYAAIGAAGQENPKLALALSILIPPLLWLAARPFLRRA